MPVRTKCDLLHLITRIFFPLICYSGSEKMEISKVFCSPLKHFIFLFFFLSSFLFGLLGIMVHETPNSVWLAKVNGIEFINVKLILIP